MERADESKEGGVAYMIEKVEASFASQTKQLNELKERYEGDFTAPKASGVYETEIRAYDDAGNITLANSQNTPGMLVEVSKWHTPKTNWGINDRFNNPDYNRIKGNLEYLHERASKLYTEFQIQDMGTDKDSYKNYYYAYEFNKFESNLEIINKHIFTQNIGISQQFYDNGTFINYEELNRIENAILSMNEILDNLEAGLARLSFRLGNWKGVKI